MTPKHFDDLLKTTENTGVDYETKESPSTAIFTPLESPTMPKPAGRTTIGWVLFVLCWPLVLVLKAIGSLLYWICFALGLLWDECAEGFESGRGRNQGRL